MAFLEKLQIQGLRSFGPNDDDAGRMRLAAVSQSNKRDKDGNPVEVSTPDPLTIILGPNGSGKTTIIECLRYITTGDHPPGSSNGRHFVHDPRMANQSAVKGCVKLVFTGVDRERVMLQRSVEATQKAKSVQMKSLTQTISKYVNGKMVSIDSKCVDFNATVLEMLGVSKPILNYVVFCHQEESNWPLDEGSKVKAKFDEIFASDRYQACLKRIVEEKKVFQKEIAADKINLGHYIADKKMADEKKAELEQKETQAKVIDGQITDDEAKLKPIVEEIQDITKMETAYADVIQKQASYRTLMGEKSRQIERTMEELRYELFDDANVSDEDIARMEKENEQAKKSAERKMEVAKSDVAELRRAVNAHQEELNILTAELAQKKSEQNANLVDKKALNAKVRAETQRLGWDAIRDNVADSSEEMKKVLTHLQRHVNEAEKHLRTVNQDMDAALNEAGVKVGELETQRALLEDSKRRSTNEIAESRREVKEINASLKRAEDAYQELETLQTALNEKEKELNDAKNLVNLNELTNKIEVKRSELKKLEARQEELKEERMQLDANQRVLSDITSKTEDRDKKQVKLEKLTVKIRPKLKEVFGDGSDLGDLSNIKERFEVKSRQVSNEVRNVTSQLQQVVSDQALKNAKVLQLKKDIDELEVNIKNFKDQSSPIINPDGDLDAELDQLKRLVEQSREDLAQKEADKYTFAKFVARLETETACPTCSRAFHAKNEAAELKADLEQEIKSIPSRVEAIKRKLVNFESQIEKLQLLVPQKRIYLDHTRLLDEKQSDLQTLEADLRQLKTQHDCLEYEKEKQTLKSDICNELQEKVFEISSMQKEVKDLEAKLTELKLQNGDLNNMRSLEEFKMEENSVGRKTTAARKEIETKQNLLITTERRINELTRDINEKKQEKLAIEKLQSSSSSLIEQRDKIESQINTLRVSITETESKMTDLDESIEAAKKDRNRLQVKKNETVQAAQKQCQEADVLKLEIGTLINRVQTYEDKGIDQVIEVKVAQVKNMNGKKIKMEADRDRLEKLMQELQDSLTRSDERRRTLLDNKRVRQLRQENAELEEKVKRYDAKLKAYNFDIAQKKKKDLIEKCNAIQIAQSVKQGRRNEISSTIMALKRELNSDKLKKAAENVRKYNTSVRCRDHIMKDLEKYYKALSYAISKFHEQRMKVINRIAKELWRATYKGNDIDYIAVRTDEVDLTAAMEKRKNCQYKVMMHKNNTEMEMRGRCSAGQKVLASLVIRLALAETFSANCGIFALDEPTTNLDSDNIASLAEALANIVEKRATLNKNFQLIIITHDEDLIDILGQRVKATDHYFKIFRNERGLSNIKKTSFNA